MILAMLFYRHFAYRFGNFFFKLTLTIKLINSHYTMIVLAMLAHDGVYNQETWKAWLSESPNVRILAYIPRPSTNFEYSIRGSDELCSTPSVWAYPSQVYTIQRLIQEVLVVYPTASSIHVISGTHIPIVSADELEKASRNTVIEVGPQNSFLPTVDNRMVLAHFEVPPFPDISPILGQLRTLFPNIRRDMLQFHATWMCLTREHAEIVAAFDFRSFELIDTYLSDGKIHAEALKERAEIHDTQNKRNVLASPDEYYIFLALRLCRVRGIQKKINAFSVFARPEEPSPIWFRDLNTSYPMLSWDTTRQQEVLVNLNLPMIVEACRGLRLKAQSSMCFFRKVDVPYAVPYWRFNPAFIFNK
jgi:hypothetical protein